MLRMANCVWQTACGKLRMANKKGEGSIETFAFKGLIYP